MPNKEEDTKTSPDNLEAGNPANKESDSKLSPYQIDRDNDNQEHKVNKPNLPVSNNASACFRFEEDTKTPSKLPAINNPGGCFGGCLGLCIGIAGAVAYAQLTMSFIASLPFLHNNWLIIFVEALGPVLAFLYAKKVKYMALFWGFLMPYMLVLLLYGACVQYFPGQKI